MVVENDVELWEVWLKDEFELGSRIGSGHFDKSSATLGVAMCNSGSCHDLEVEVVMSIPISKSCQLSGLQIVIPLWQTIH